MTNETRSPKEIERDIERERAGLTNTLSDLQDRFSIESLARQVSDQVREHGGDIGRSVSDAVKRNPLALALTGAGLAWLMLSDRSGGHDHAAPDPLAPVDADLFGDGGHVGVSGRAVGGHHGQRLELAGFGQRGGLGQRDRRDMRPTCHHVQ